MERYNYRPHVLTVSVQIIDMMDEVQDSREDIHGFGVYDSRHGNTEDAWVAFSRDRDTAMRIMRLLNADEKMREKVIEHQNLFASVPDNTKGLSE